MRKIIVTIIAAILFLPAFAQEEVQVKEYAPKKGSIQGSLLLGNSMFYSDVEYTLYTSQTPSMVTMNPWNLRLSNENYNSIGNMIGAEIKYFVTDQIAISFVGAGSINRVPSRDYVDGLGTPGDWDYIPSYDYIEAMVGSRFAATLGANYYFKTQYERVQPYVGIEGSYQFARLDALTPYKGEAAIEDVDFGVRVGQVYGISPAVVVGIEYAILPGLLIGFEIKPFSYYYSGVELYAQPGLQAMTGENHEFSFLAQPRFKIGFRF